ncbi:phosphatidylinositol 3,4,5-trisphosphate 3-phosphatase and protein-tyrosine-phosphatase PTEN1-like [Primulina tabacum]|uniref:phosphatidylinositol 3,4,5-trisphosphate 3-phosphatase and protein-tyrosine-phosphatase PTEN1-like n=1 Tax=Primulina tabacum TaxID=48773 RepID=UPI003F59682C
MSPFISSLWPLKKKPQIFIRASHYCIFLILGPNLVAFDLLWLIQESNLNQTARQIRATLIWLRPDGVKVFKERATKGRILNLKHVQNRLLNCLWRNYTRNLVSKKRRRMLVAGYDLDMTYVTDRLLAMSFPAERMRAMYRNPLRQRYHSDDNHVPPIPIIKAFCEDVHSWLSSDPKNIAVMHCMAEKGRTGLMVSSYLVYTGMSAEKAMDVYAEKRTTNNGVSIPSQRRYVGYWEKLLSSPEGVNLGHFHVNLPTPCERDLERIRLYDTINIDQIFVAVSELQENPGQRYYPPAEVSKSCCRKIKKRYERSIIPQYYYSLVGTKIDTTCE